MALPFATAHLVRIITDRVLENVTRQLMQQRSAALPGEATLRQSSPELADVVEHFNVSLMKLHSEVKSVRKEVSSLEDELTTLDERVKRMEDRWGFYALLRVVVIVALAFVLGFGLALLMRLGGWAV